MLSFIALISKFLMYLYDPFTHILQDCFTVAGAIVILVKHYTLYISPGAIIHDCPSYMIAPMPIKQLQKNMMMSQMETFSVLLALCEGNLHWLPVDSTHKGQ